MRQLTEVCASQLLASDTHLPIESFRIIQVWNHLFAKRQPVNFGIGITAWRDAKGWVDEREWLGIPQDTKDFYGIYV